MAGRAVMFEKHARDTQKTRPPRAHAARGASTRLLQHTQSRGMVAVLNMIGDGAIVHFQELGEEKQLIVAAVAGNELEGRASVQLVLRREAGDPSVVASRVAMSYWLSRTLWSVRNALKS